MVETHLKSDSVDAPIKKGDELGTADIIYAEKVIGRVTLVSGSNVKKDWILGVIRAIKRFFVSDGMKVVYVLIALAVIGFIIAVIRLNSGRGKKRKVKYIPYDARREKEDDR